MLFPAFSKRRAAGRRSRPGRRGYTLVEMMIAMLLISVVVTSGVWALNPGAHDISAWLPTEFCAVDPPNCKLTYTVFDDVMSCGAGTPCKRVQFNITWKEPQ